MIPEVYDGSIYGARAYDAFCEFADASEGQLT